MELNGDETEIRVCVTEGFNGEDRCLLRNELAEMGLYSNVSIFKQKNAYKETPAGVFLD